MPSSLSSHVSNSSRDRGSGPRFESCSMQKVYMVAIASLPTLLQPTLQHTHKDQQDAKVPCHGFQAQWSNGRVRALYPGCRSSNHEAHLELGSRIKMDPIKKNCSIKIWQIFLHCSLFECLALFKWFLLKTALACVWILPQLKDFFCFFYFVYNIKDIAAGLSKSSISYFNYC